MDWAEVEDLMAEFPPKCPFTADVIVVSKEVYACGRYTRKPQYRMVFEASEGVKLVWESTPWPAVMAGNEVGHTTRIRGTIWDARGDGWQIMGTTKAGRKKATVDLAVKAAVVSVRKAKKIEAKRLVREKFEADNAKATSLGIEALQNEILKAHHDVLRALIIVDAAKAKKADLEKVMLGKLELVYTDKENHPLSIGRYWDCPNSPLGLCLMDKHRDFCAVCGQPQERK